MCMEIYLYDGTFYGLLTIVFNCYISKKIPIKIIPINLYVPNILDTTKLITTDYEKSQRIFNGIVKNISYDDWFKNSIDLSDGIWIGNGLGDQFTLKVTTNSRELREDIDPKFGYVVNRGKAVQVKFIIDE